MSGICGIFNQDGAPVPADDLQRMIALLERRGPEGSRHWHSGPAGLGHTLLATTPEALHESLPVVDTASGCVITADVRLDNRDELLSQLQLPPRPEGVGDAGLILAAYLRWGESCVDRLLGDFAFGIWDPRRRTLFGARDHFGLKPFYYHHSDRRFVAFASSARAIVALPQVPYAINEGRIADFLVQELEGIDKTSTFFEGVYRLPPAHTLMATPEGAKVRQYWSLEPEEALKLPSDEAYAEAFLEVFTEAVRCRLRGAGPVGCMLSGGMDSGSIVAVASRILAESGRGPLPTFSAVGPDPSTCVETRTIHAALSMPDLNPTLIRHDLLEEFFPELEEATWNLEEPFEYNMTLIRVIYLAASQRGVKVVLDGVAGDVVLSEGRYLARLLRSGRLLAAVREVTGLRRFYGKYYHPMKTLWSSARAAYVPEGIRRLHRRTNGERLLARHVKSCLQRSFVHPDFAARVSIAPRFRSLLEQDKRGLRKSEGQESAAAITHAYLLVGRERYERTASALGVEPRDPFLDRRLVRLCVRLPGQQKLKGGWPKVVLRRALRGLLPETVLWRTGKEHLGWTFTYALMDRWTARMRLDMERPSERVSSYVSYGAVRTEWAQFAEAAGSESVERVYATSHLSAWLFKNRNRPAGANWMSNTKL